MKMRFDVLYGIPAVKSHQVPVMTVMDNEPTWNGVRVRLSHLSVTTRTAFSVARNCRRRRRAYFVVRKEWQEPVAYRLADGSLVMHPDLWWRLQQQFDPRQEPALRREG